MKKDKEYPPLMASKVIAGYPSPAEHYTEKPLDLNELLVANPPATFFVRVEGDSMINAFIQPDDILVVDRSLNPVNGSIVIACVDSEFTVKYFRQNGKMITLEAANPKYQPITFHNGMQLSIFGVVTSVIHQIIRKKTL